MDPFHGDPGLAGEFIRLLCRSHFIGLSISTDDDALDLPHLGVVVERMSSAGLPIDRNRVVVQSLLATSERHAWSDNDSHVLRAALHALNDQIEMSPQPDREWKPVLDVLGGDLLAQLIGASESSIRRYSSGVRPTPQDAAERLHFVAMVLADLAGSYNDYGIRRWFTRPRAALDSLKPADLLGDFDPDGRDAARVKDLAARLIGAGAA